MSALEYKIVPVTAALAQGHRDVVDFVARERKYLNFTEGFTLEETQEYVRQSLENDYPHFMVVSDGKVVGWCDIRPPSSRAMEQHVGSVGVGLLPEFRGCGIGRKLMEAALAAAKKKYTRIELTVYDTNVRAKALYESLGFEVEGLERRCKKMDGEYLNMYRMALLVDE